MKTYKFHYRAGEVVIEVSAKDIDEAREKIKNLDFKATVLRSCLDTDMIEIAIQEHIDNGGEE